MTALKQLSRKDVATILEIEPNTVDVYRRRTREGTMTFPEPAGYLGNRPWWTEEQIEEYIRTKAPGGWHGQQRNRTPEFTDLTTVELAAS